MNNLTEIGLVEMNPLQLNKVEGGVWWVPVAIMGGIYLYDHREQLVEGYTDVMKGVLK